MSLKLFIANGFQNLYYYEQISSFNWNWYFSQCVKVFCADIVPTALSAVSAGARVQFNDMMNILTKQCIRQIACSFKTVQSFNQCDPINETQNQL